MQEKKKQPTFSLKHLINRQILEYMQNKGNSLY